MSKKKKEPANQEHEQEIMAGKVPFKKDKEE